MKTQTIDWKNLPFYQTYLRLKEIGYVLGDIVGKEITDEPTGDQDHISIILPTAVSTRIEKFWFFEWVTYERVFLGTIYFFNESKKADHDNWVFEVYGRQNFEEAKGIAKYLQEKLMVKSVTVNLVNEEMVFETSRNEFYQDF